MAGFQSNNSVAKNPLKRCFVGASCLVVFALAIGIKTEAQQDTTEVLNPRQSVDYATEIKPVFDRHCKRCHGPKTSESQFRVDRRSSLLSGGDHGKPGIVPGDSKNSFLIQVISGADTDLVMPPGDNTKLSDSQIALLKTWIDLGAKMDQNANGPEIADQTTAVEKSDHWSLQPVARAVPPEYSNNRWVHNPIDAFILRKLNQNGLSPSPEADRRKLVRRLYLVMLGLPPPPDRVDQFVNDESPRAWSELVDEVLASPQYGERWARHWLDIVRFGETDGFETNRERPDAWRYRDWVIDSLNADKPYDQFVVEQIAGDAVGEPVGTGFLVAGPHDIVKSPDINLTLMQRQDELADIVNATGTTFIGLTLGCARCHDHKFDPISQKDFYSLQAVFAGVQHGNGSIPISAGQRLRLLRNALKIKGLRKRLMPFIPETNRGFKFIDDSTIVDHNSTGIQLLVPPDGIQQTVASDADSFSGSDQRLQRTNGGSFRWWHNRPGTDFAAYRPQIRGRFRIWLSWGIESTRRTSDAVYLLDLDGILKTKADQQTIASINQQKIAPGTRSGTSPGDEILSPRWSGLFNAGSFDLQPGSAIILRGGKTGQQLTADLIVFEAISDQKPTHKIKAPEFRQPQSSKHNIETFAPRTAKYLRFTVLQTNTENEPCFDEIEVYSGKTNVALASYGTVATASGNYKGNPKHRLSHVNDGKYGNDHSWISDEKGRGWLQLEFPEPIEIDRIEWSRDRNSQYSDRTAAQYRIETAVEPSRWSVVASSDDRLPTDIQIARAPVYEFDRDSKSKAEGQALLQELNELREQRKRLSEGPQAYIGTFTQPQPTYRLHRGDPMARREQVAPDTVRAIGSLELDSETPEQTRRLKFARWLASKDNPLTARVMVNRLWQYHFGNGLVATASDFGAAGTKPTHPELLDWLARQFMDENWSIKQMHRRILLSSTWRQDGLAAPTALNVDADSSLLWRFPGRRLAAETIRDSMLSVSGVLDLKMGGPGFSAFEVQLENVRHYFPKQAYGTDDWRRMIYMTKVRQEQDSTFGVFDCPDASQVMPKRSRSTTPLQALNLFNSRFVMQQAELFAARLKREAGHSISDQIALAYLACYSRGPSSDELESGEDFATKHGMKLFCRAILNSNEFLFIP